MNKSYWTVNKSNRKSLLSTVANIIKIKILGTLLYTDIAQYNKT